MKIFINIVAYKDPLLLDTINSVYNTANNKENLIFGIVEQEEIQNSININSLEFKNQIRYIRIDPVYSRGPCWPRSMAQSLWKGEEYYLQIDSHMIFTDGWDTILIAQYNELKKYHEKPVITMYVLRCDMEKNFIRSNNLASNSSITCTTTTTTKLYYSDACLGLIVDENNAFKLHPDVYVGIKCDFISDKKIIHGYLASAHFLFASGKIIDEVPYDPFLFFCGEEQSLALRLWTNGYNIFHTNIPIYHRYNPGNDGRITVWGDEIEEKNRLIKWWEHDIESKKRLKSIVTGENLGVYGIGKIRTLEQYMKFSGIDYLTTTIHDKAKTGEIVFALDYKDSIDI